MAPLSFQRWPSQFLIVSPVVPNVTSRTPRTSMVSSCFPSSKSKSSSRAQINAILNPQDDPIVKEALKFLIVSPVVPNVTSRTPRTSMVSSCFPSSKSSGRAQINAILNPQDDPIVKEALKEPVAFLGGVFAGLLRLDLSEDPLRDWVERTSKAAGLENMDVAEVEDETPEEISIE